VSLYASFILLPFTHLDNVEKTWYLKVVREKSGKMAEKCGKYVLVQGIDLA